MVICRWSSVLGSRSLVVGQKQSRVRRRTSFAKTTSGFRIRFADPSPTKVGDGKPHPRTVLPRAKSQQPRAILANDQRPTTLDGAPRIAYLDCFSGISGDMFLGALVDAGVPRQLFENTVASLNIGATLEISRVNRSGISATKVDVIVNGEKDAARESRAGPP